MKYAKILAATLVLTGCGSDSSNTIPGQFVGIWQLNSESQPSNRYLLIKSDGTFGRYIYGSNLDNCYDLFDTATISLIEGNTYSYTFQDFSATFNMQITDINQLRLTGTFESMDFDDYYNATDLLESDLEPRCD